MIEEIQAKDLLILQNVKKHYPVVKGFLRREAGSIKAVDGVDINLRRAETLGLVGESGCGKSTLGRVILRLEEPTEGRIFFDGKDLAEFSSKEIHHLRRRMQVIFQDPYSSLNPRQTVGRIIGEGLVIHKVGSVPERRNRVEYLMDVVGLRPEQIHQYPHEFSGGQRQRIGIARALALQPELIICDEPLSALDVSIQAQVLNLLQDLQEQYGLTYLFISHDLSVVRHISDRVAVMYLGSLVELAGTRDLFDGPFHPYTRTLLDAVPVPDPTVARKGRKTPEELPRHAGSIRGCHFEPRCPHAMPVCRDEVPLFKEIGPNHWVKCFLYGGDTPEERRRLEPSTPME